MARLFGGVRAPSRWGTFLRTFTFGHVRQLDAGRRGRAFSPGGAIDAAHSRFRARRSTEPEGRTLII